MPLLDREPQGLPQMDHRILTIDLINLDSAVISVSHICEFREAITHVDRTRSRATRP